MLSRIQEINRKLLSYPSKEFCRIIANLLLDATDTDINNYLDFVASVLKRRKEVANTNIEINTILALVTEKMCIEYRGKPYHLAAQEDSESESNSLKINII